MHFDYFFISRRTILLLLCIFCGGIQAFSQSKNEIELSAATLTSWETALQDDSIRTVIVQGKLTKAEWKEVARLMKFNKQISTVILANNELRKMPEVFIKNRNIRTLCVRGNEKLEPREMTDVLQRSHYLQVVGIDAVSADEIPGEWVDIIHLKEIICLETDILTNYHNSEAYLNPPYFRDFDIVESAMIEDRALKVSLVAKDRETDFTNASAYKPAVIVPSDAMQLMRGNEQNSPIAEVNIFEKKYTSFSSPMPWMDQPRDYTIIDNGINSVVEYPSGTEVFIPAGTFVDSKGDVVEGEVIIDYREFRDQTDFMVYGIPMSGIGNDPMNSFVSAGMFEINASVEGEEVFVKPGKEIKINFESTAADEDYPLWNYNDQTGQWEQVGNTRTVSNEKKDFSGLQITAAYDAYIRTLGQNKMVYDTTSFDNRYVSSNYMGCNRIQRYESERLSDLGGPIRIANVKRSKSNEIVFQLDNTGAPRRDYNYLEPQWFVLKNSMHSRSSFKREYAKRNQGYLDVRVFQNGESLTLQLKEGDEYKDLDVEFTRLSPKNRKAYIVDNDKVMLRYAKLYNRMRGRWESTCKRGKLKNNMLLTGVSSESNAWLAAKSVMTPAEAQWSMEQWVLHCDSIQRFLVDIINGQDLTASNFTRAMSISKMGIYNCDQVSRMEEPLIVDAEYKCDQQIPAAQKLYVIDKEKNMIVAYQHDLYMGYSCDHFALSRGRDQSLILVDNSQRFFIYRYRKNEINADGTYTFEMIHSSEIKTVADLRAILEI